VFAPRALRFPSFCRAAEADGQRPLAQRGVARPHAGLTDRRSPATWLERPMPLETDSQVSATPKLPRDVIAVHDAGDIAAEFMFNNRTPRHQGEPEA